MAKGSMTIPSEPMSDKERQLKYQTEDDLRALTRAEEILEDKERSKRAMALAQEQADETSSVIERLSKRGLISDKAKAKAQRAAKADDED
jgi:hypothetical protein